MPDPLYYGYQNDIIYVYINAKLFAVFRGTLGLVRLGLLELLELLQVFLTFRYIGKVFIIRILNPLHFKSIFLLSLPYCSTSEMIPFIY